mgnify:CR=1 FL=1
MSRTLLLAGKALRQQVRDPLSAALTLLTPATLVVAFRLLLAEGASPSFSDLLPSLLIFAAIMQVFHASLSLAREKEAGTLERVAMTGVRPRHLVAAAALLHGAVALLTLGITLITARVVGFVPQGSTGAALGALLLCATACAGLGMVIGALARSAAQAFVIASASMFVLLLLSGLLFPLPEATWWRGDGWGVGPLDLLPTVHTLRLVAGILGAGALWTSLADAWLALTLLCALFVTAGVWALGRSARNYS